MQPANLLPFYHASYMCFLFFHCLFFLPTYWCWILKDRPRELDDDHFPCIWLRNQKFNSPHHKAVMWEGAVDASDLQCKIPFCPVCHIQPVFIHLIVRNSLTLTWVCMARNGLLSLPQGDFSGLESSLSSNHQYGEWFHQVLHHWKEVFSCLTSLGRIPNFTVSTHTH